MKRIYTFTGIGVVAVGAIAFVATRSAKPAVTSPVVSTSSQADAPAQTQASPTTETPLQTPDTPPAKAPVKSASPQSSLAGSYRCFSYNVSGGGGGNCRLFSPIVLKSDSTYSVSSEHGTYTVSGNVITLSESKLRGPGKIIDGNKIRFEYDYNGWHHTITYLREGN